MLMAAAMFFMAGVTAEGQSKGFKLGQWSEIQNAIIMELNRSYVDSLPVDRIMRAGVDAMLEELDPHSAYLDAEEMKAADIKAGGFDAIKEFQRRWSQIGFVPIKQKEALQKEYKSIVDGMFATLRSSERDRSINRFRERVSTMKGSGQLRSERERLFNKVRQMEQDIALLENNIGFFSKSKNAETLIADVREKIERTKRDMSEIVEKIRLIDEQEANNA